MEDLARELLTSVGRLMLLLGRKGEVTFKDARIELGSQVYFALRQAAVLGLTVEEEGGKRIKLSEKGKAVAECLARCFGSSSG